jgi:hypothetical protein
MDLMSVFTGAMGICDLVKKNFMAKRNEQDITIMVKHLLN